MKRNRDVEGEQARILINFKIVTFLVSLFFVKYFYITSYKMSVHFFFISFNRFDSIFTHFLSPIYFY